jgi:hypothetical protein
MDGKFEQRVCIKFCVKLGKSATETLEMLCEAFGEHSLSRTAVFNGIHVSRTVECQLKERSGRSSTSNSLHTHHHHHHHHHHLSSGAGTTGQIVADVPSGVSLSPNPKELKKNYTPICNPCCNSEEIQCAQYAHSPYSSEPKPKHVTN